MVVVHFFSREALGPAVHFLARDRAQNDGVPQTEEEFGVLMIAYTIASLWQPEAAA